MGLHRIFYFTSECNSCTFFGKRPDKIYCITPAVASFLSSILLLIQAISDAMKNKMKVIVLFLAIIINSGVLSVNVYNSIVDAPNWGADIPASIETARSYFTVKNPADFFKIVGVVIHILGINCVIRFWKTNKQIRLYTLSALILIFITDILTFSYFFPRNDVLFDVTSTADIQTLTSTWEEWSMMNWIRSLIILGIATLYSLALNTFFSQKLTS